MSLLREILAELLGMFVSDARLTLGVLAVVALAALAARALPDQHELLSGAILLVGCLAVLAAAVFVRARKG